MSSTVLLNLLRHLLNETRGTGVLHRRTEKELRSAIADLERELQLEEGRTSRGTFHFERIDLEGRS